MRHTKWLTGLGVVALMGALAPTAQAITTDPTQIANDAAIDTPGQIEHCDDVVPTRNFGDIFDCGDELFGTSFNDVDGVGANVGDGGRFTRVPRSDRKGTREWANHTPPRATGPNSSSCANCHNQGAEDGAGEVVANNVRDPLGTNNPGMFIQRNPPHTFALGPVQLLAQQITDELRGAAGRARDRAMSTGAAQTVNLVSQGINYGTITANPNGTFAGTLQGIDADLVPKPFDWKGVVSSVRFFVRDASHQEIGMNPQETAGTNVDGDGDGVVNEMTINDMTALAVYQAAQPRPTTQIELNALRQRLNSMAGGAAVAAGFGFPVLSQTAINNINAGSTMFNTIGCNSCHIPQLLLNADNLIFREPANNTNSQFFRDTPNFPAGQPGLNPDPARSISFDVTRDQPDNVIRIGTTVVTRLGAIQRNANGQGIVRLFGDLKRHDMGPRLAENIDTPTVVNPMDGTTNTPVAVTIPAATWLTENLWGVGSTAQYLHDGRATTIREAIREHGGEAQASRDAFFRLNATNQRVVIVFLKNLVLFNDTEDESGTSSTGSVSTTAVADPGA